MEIQVRTKTTTPIYSFTALKTKQREVKTRGQKEVVHITENGNAAYIFCSEEVFSLEKARAVEEALYEQRLSALLQRGEEDKKNGHIFHGVEAVRKELKKRSSCGKN